MAVRDWYCSVCGMGLGDAERAAEYRGVVAAGILPPLAWKRVSDLSIPYFE